MHIDWLGVAAWASLFIAFCILGFIGDLMTSDQPDTITYDDVKAAKVVDSLRIVKTFERQSREALRALERLKT